MTLFRLSSAYHIRDNSFFIPIFGDNNSRYLYRCKDPDQIEDKLVNLIYIMCCLNRPSSS